MARFLILISAVSLSLVAGAVDNRDSCRSEGAAVGREAATSFCKVLEREFANETVFFPFGAGHAARVCELQAQLACKREMARTARQDFPLCARLIQINWRNSRGEGARSRWIQYQQGSCRIELPDVTRQN
jgi:hypothetical protein